MLRRSNCVKRQVLGVFESLSGHPAQVIPELGGRGLEVQRRAPIPIPQPSAQSRREQAFDRFVDPGRVGALKHAKPIVCRYQSTDTPQFSGNVARLVDQFELKARLQ